MVGLSLNFLSIFLFTFLLFMVEVQGQGTMLNVMKYGARPDGKTDNTKVFFAVWKQVCKFGKRVVIYVPKGTFKVGPIVFDGPCKGPIGFKIVGVLKAPTDEATRHVDHWITFRYVDRLTINGGGVLDGQGHSAWNHNDCATNQNCRPLPVTMRFDFVTNSLIHHITSLDSKNFHFNLFACNNLKFHHIKIQAPDESPNTDGIHLAASKHIQILDSFIRTGDDCISMGPGSEFIDISRVACGPGHGISIGSLGGTKNEEDVTGITVKNCTLSNTMNGVRIKTWGRSYPSNVYNLTFEDILIKNVENPIIIDQEYCPSGRCPKESSKVKIRDVRFRNIWGTTSTKLAVNLICSQHTPCQNIELKDINTAINGGGNPTSFCANAKGVARGRQRPPSCLHG